jgi:hypothetical protein
MVTHVQLRIRSLVIGALLMGVAASAVAVTYHGEIHQTTSCLAIAEGVCLCVLIFRAGLARHPRVHQMSGEASP